MTQFIRTQLWLTLIKTESLNGRLRIKGIDKEYGSVKRRQRSNRDLVAKYNGLLF